MVGCGTLIHMFVCRFLLSQPNSRRQVDPPALLPASSTRSPQSDLFFLSREERERPARVTIAFGRRRLASLPGRYRTHQPRTALSNTSLGRPRLKMQDVARRRLCHVRPAPQQHAL